MTVWISTNSKSYLWHLDQKENNFKLIKIGNLLELTPLKKLVYEKIVVILGGGCWYQFTLSIQFKQIIC